MRPFVPLVAFAAGVLSALALPALPLPGLRGIGFALVVPPLLFEAAWRLDRRAAFDVWPQIAALAGPGVVLTAGAVAAALHLVAGSSWYQGWIAGTIIAATDPIALGAILERTALSSGLRALIECEALFNDATAVIALAVVLGLGAERTPVLPAITRDATGIAIAVAASGLIGIAAGAALRQASGPIVAVAITLAAAYAAYASGIAGGSGVLAVVICALTMRSVEGRGGDDERDERVDVFWRAADAVMSVVLFALAGAAVARVHAPTDWRLAAAAVGGVVLSRMVLVAALPAPASVRVQRRWRAVAVVTAVRGALPLALALSLPGDIVHAGEVIVAVVAVVLTTLTIGAGGATVLRLAMQ